MSLPHVVCVCGDPGGANALAPVLATLAADGKVDVAVYAYNEGTAVLKRSAIDATVLEGDAVASAAADCLRREDADAVVTATSHNGVDWEKHFVAAAHDRSIPSVAVLDFWSNYRERLADAAGGLDRAPDAIAVMDERARIEMVDAGFPAERLVVTGQPAFDALAGARARFTPERRSAVRSSVGVAQDELFVVFASQPLRQLYGDSLGYDQHEVAGLLVDALDAVSVKSARPIVLLIRPHPRERAEDYAGFATSRVRILVSDAGDGRDCAMAADLVTGMTTALLVEACHLGCVVVSLQPGLRAKDVLPTNAWGASAPVYRADDVRPVVERMLLDPSARGSALERLAALALDGNAARRVADLIYAHTAKSAFQKERRAGTRA